MNRLLKRALYANALTPELEQEFVAELATGEPNVGLAMDASLILKDRSLANITRGLAESWRKA